MVGSLGLGGALEGVSEDGRVWVRTAGGGSIEGRY